MLSKCFGALVAAAVLLAGARARADKPRIAVVGVGGGDNVSAELRERVARAVAGGLAASGADVRTEPGPVAYRVRGTLDVEGRNYTLRLEIVDEKTGAIVDSREDRCEICTETEALETASVAASALKAQVFKKRPAVSLGDAPVAAAAPVEPAHAPPVITQTSTPDDDESKVAPHRKLGIAGVVAGVLAAGVGGWLISIHHQGTCDAADKTTGCPDRYNTAAGGTTLLVGGVLALTGGVLAVAGVF